MVHYIKIYSTIKRVLLRNHPDKNYNSIHAETELAKPFLSYSQRAIISLNDTLNDAFMKKGITLNLSAKDLKDCKRVRHIFNVIDKKLNHK